MNNVIIVTIFISALWIRFSDAAVKCYHQECEEDDDDGSGYRCYHGAGDKGGKEGEIAEDETGCYELHHIRDGKLFKYQRNIIHREGYDSSEKEKVKDGCVTEKRSTAEFEEEWETCYCFKDLCNNKHPIPEGASIGYSGEVE